MHVTMPSDSVHGAHLWSTPTPVPLARHHTIAFGEGVLRCVRGDNLDGPGDEPGPSRLVTRPMPAPLSPWKYSYGFVKSLRVGRS
jgi:hypothetical protein